MKEIEDNIRRRGLWGLFFFKTLLK